jgi:signal transduction histidine kinase
MIFDLTRNLIADYTFDSATKLKGKTEQRFSNLSRIEYLLYIGLPLYLILFASFYFKDVQDGTQASVWRLYLLITFSFIILAFSVIGILAVWLKKKEKQHSLIGKALPHFTFLIILIAGAVISGVDQIVSTSITSFLIACILAALAIYKTPLNSAIYYLIGFILFIIILHHFQPDTVLLFSNGTHGLLIIVISWFLSIILWYSNLKRIEKDLIIEKQKDELAKHNNELTIKTLALNSSNKTKDKLFSVIAHDLRGPLANLTAMVQLLKNGDASENEFKEILPGLTIQISQTNELLDNLLNWSRTNLQVTKAEPETINLNTIADEIIQLYRAQIDNKKISINNNIKDSHLAFADKNMVQLITRNLLSNAIKFSHTGGSIMLDSFIMEDFIHITIRDEGLGISNEKIKLLLTDEYCSTPGTKGEKGTGLGLILCREFVEKNRGKLNITSTVGKGSTFSFSLPVE